MVIYIITGKLLAEKTTNILSSPIYIDNVACYGSDDKLIDCAYLTDTSEDSHNNDVSIDCSGSNSESGGGNDSGDSYVGQGTNTGLTVAIVALIVSILVAMGLTLYILCTKQTAR